MIIPTPSLFAHPSHLHGQSHVARVMVHAFRLLEATGSEALSARVWAAVFLHDLARTHDGMCHVHGANAVTRWRSEPPLAAYLATRGVTADDAGVTLAVTVHCKPSPHEPPRDHPDWTLVALLKDADGLDRVRLGDLDPNYLRLPESLEMVEFAEQLFQTTSGRVAEGDAHFGELLATAEEVLGRRIPVPAAVALRNIA